MLVLTIWTPPHTLADKPLQIEDWQGEKCDVSLLEGINADLIRHMLDTACDLLRQSELSKPHIEALCDRLSLRKVTQRASPIRCYLQSVQAVLELHKLDLLKEMAGLWYHTAVARGMLHRVHTSHPKSLPPDSPAHLAMDPYIARRLPNFMPIRVTELPPFEQTVDTFDEFLAYWSEAGHLVSSPSLMRWEVSSRHV